MVGWWASKTNHNHPSKLNGVQCSMFNVSIETSSLQKILKVHEIYKTRAYNIVISMNQCLLNPFPPILHHEYMYRTMYHKSALFMVDGSYEN